MSAMPDSIEGMRKEVPKSVDELVKLPPYLMLMVVGGGLAVLLGLIIGVLEIIWGAVVASWIFGAILHMIVCIIVGPLLIFAYIWCKRDLFIGTVLAGVFSVVLIALGGIAGIIGGVFGLIGAILAFLKYLEMHENYSQPAAQSAVAPQAQTAPPPSPSPQSRDAAAQPKKFCVKCGMQLRENAAFCDSCGAKTA